MAPAAPSGWEESARAARQLAQMAIPLWAQNFAQILLGLIAIAFVGHMNDPLALSQVVLATSLFNVTGASIISGLSAGMETFCGQGMGAGNHAMLGTVLQRAVAICLLVCAPVTLLWANAGPIILRLGQPQAIAAGAARYLLQVSPCIYMLAISECLKRYLLAQRVVVPGTVITAVTTLCAPVFYWLTIYKMKLGLDGAAAGFVLCTFTSTSLMIAYTAARDARRRRRPDATWTGLTLDAFRGWGQYLGLAVPAMVAVCSEWWTYEVVIFMAGLLPNAEVAVGVMGLAFQVSAVAYMLAMALSAAANTRVANELGAGNARAARASCWVAAAAVVLLQSAQSGACFLARRQVIGLLSSNEQVEALALIVMPVLVVTFIGDGTNAVLQGVLRGAGRQALGAAMNVIGYWAFGVPLAMLLGFHLHLGVLGFWAALLATTSGQALVQAAVLSRIDWGAEVARAAALAAAPVDAAGATDGGGGGGATAAARSKAAAADVAAAEAAAAALPEDERPLLLDTSRSRSVSEHGSASFGPRLSIDLVALAGTPPAPRRAPLPPGPRRVSSSKGGGGPAAVPAAAAWTLEEAEEGLRRGAADGGECAADAAGGGRRRVGGALERRDGAGGGGGKRRAMGPTDDDVSDGCGGDVTGQRDAQARGGAHAKLLPEDQ